MKHLFSILLFALFCSAWDDKIQLVSPTVEMQDGSQPLATSEPRFSWQYESEENNVTQTEYRIIVASSEENIRKGIGDLWDSKSIASNRMLYIPYEGKKLKSRDCCWWKVYTTVTYGKKRKKIHLESDIQHFEISLLSPDDWHAHWIGYDFEDDDLDGHTAIAARYLRKEFSLKENISKARLYISGLGVYNAFINGGEVAPDELLKPTLSDYTRRIYFNAYDVTEMLHEGDNVIGVILEGGRFTTVRHDSIYLEWCGINHAVHYGLPQLLTQLEVTYSDGTTDTIVSGEGWRITNRGPIRKSNEFDGETCDFRYDLGSWMYPNYDDRYSNEFDDLFDLDYTTFPDHHDNNWQTAVVDYDRQNMYHEDIYNPRHRVNHEYPVVSLEQGGRLPDEYHRPDPMSLLTPQPNPNIKVQGVVKPIAVFKKNDKWIIDMGQNMVGYIHIMADEPKPGDTITIRYAETLNSDSTLYTDNLRDAEVTDRFIIPNDLKHVHGIGWCPKFTYHGFRYVEVTGLRSKPEIDYFIKGYVIYDEMQMTGSFECSNEIMNAVYRNATWGIRSNYRSMPTDCPQRDERMGWTGDRTIGNYGESYIFNNHHLYAKWLQDIEDCQFENGALSDVVPAYWRNYTDNMTWPGAFITVADMLHTRFGDVRPIHQHYEAMKRWMLHMKQHYLKDGILVRDTYGDWCVPPESPELIHTKDTNRMTWPANLSTPFYVYLAGKMAGFAQLLGQDDDVTLWQNDIAYITAAYNARYLDTITGYYGHNTVTANILPLAFGMVPDDIEAPNSSHFNKSTNKQSNYSTTQLFKNSTLKERVFANIIEKTENEFGGHVSTGVVGIQQLMRTLTENGRGDLALRLATNDTYPSWGYMVRKGATTIWELWNGDTADPAMNSGNHVMLLGDLILWEYEYLGGIRTLEPGYSKIQLKPYPIEGLDYVNCSYRSVSGLIESNWRRIKTDNKNADDCFEWDILIPANTTAEVWLPTAKGYEKKVLTSGKHHLSSKL